MKYIFYFLILISIHSLEAIDIDLFSGNLVEHCVDLAVEGQEPIYLCRSLQNQTFCFNHPLSCLDEKQEGVSYSFSGGKLSRISTSDCWICIEWANEEHAICTASNGQSITYCFAEGVLVRAGETQFEYDCGKLCKRLCCNLVESFSYDRQGRVCSHKIGDGIFYFSYEEGTSTSIDPLGRKTLTRFDSLGNACRIEFYDGTSENRIYQEGRLVEITLRDGSKEFFTYDTSGNLLETRHLPDNNWTRFYYEDDLLVGQQRANGEKILFEYENGKLILQKTFFQDGSCKVESRTYDEKGRLALASTQFNDQIRKAAFSYDPLIIYESLETQEGETPIQKVEKQFYQGKLFIDKITNEFGELNCQMHYDLLGRPLQEQDAEGKITSFIYDEKGLLCCKEVEGQIESYNYDAAGNLLAKIDSFGNQTTIAYDNFDRPIRVCHPPVQMPDGSFESPVVSYEYDHLNRLASLTNPKGGVFFFHYTPEGKPESITLPDGSKASANSPPPANLQKQPIPKGGASQFAVYDAYGRPVAVKSETPKRIAYDLCGNKILEQTPERTVEWDYDLCNRIIKISNNGQETHFSYDMEGLVSKMVKPDGTALYYEYDSAHRLNRISSSDDTVDDTFEYDSGGRIVLATDWIHGQTTERIYDDEGRLLKETLGTGLAFTNRYLPSGKRYEQILPDASRIDYIWDDNKLAEITRNGCTYRYSKMNEAGRVVEISLIGKLGTLQRTHDEQDRLIAISSPHFTQKITRDASGKVLSTFQNNKLHSYEYKEGKGVVAEQGEFLENYREEKSLLQDANGNLVSKNGFTLRYDAFDRLIEATRDKDLHITFLYDPFHRRLGKTTEIWDRINQRWGAKTTHLFLWDEANEIGAANTDGQINELRVLGLGHGAEIGAACMVELNGIMYQPLHNHRGDITALVDPKTKTVAMRADYSAFGKAAVEGKIASPWLFSSKRYEAQLDLYYFGKRYYDPDSRLWITPDPLATYDGAFSHTFAQNDPVNRMDMNGLFSFSAAAWSCLSTLVKTINFAKSMLNTLQNQFDFESYLRPKFDQAGSLIFGRRLLNLSGFYSDKPTEGVYGQGEFSDNLRVTFINGMLNSRADYKESLLNFCQSHGGINIHYIFNPTNGWTWDLLKCFYAKMGFETPQARMLAQTWKRLIAEMGGTDGNAAIVHYCHSIGGTHTSIAKSLMTPEELRMIHVISIGSATILDDSGFGKVTNYVSKRDGVCMLDPIQWVQAATNRLYHTHMLGTYAGIPIVDHPLFLPTYANLIQQLGSDLLENYL